MTDDSSSDKNPAQPAAQPPDDSTEVRIGKRHEIAAGLPAVVQTMRFTFREMGAVRGIRELLHLNQKKGFDCQSCAWPSPDEHRSMTEFCENGVKAVADEATTRRVTREFFAQYSVAQLAAQSDHWLGHQGRLTEPMVLRPGATHYEPISWPAAFSLVAAELHALASPNEASFYTSGRTSNEAAFLYQLFVRQFGTNNLPDCSNMCHESSGCALKETIGVGKGTVTLHDFDQADAIFLIGQNPGTNHPRMLTSLERAKERGCKIVSINPLPETGNFRFKNPQDFKNPLKAIPTLLGQGTHLSDLWLPVRLGGDMAVFKGIIKEMFEAEARQPGTVLDARFIGEQTTGFAEFKERIDATSWEEILHAGGLAREQIAAAAQIAVEAKAIICCWAMGLTQQTDAVATIQEIVNFLLLGGNIGRPGAGVCPVRGHSNVQGDRTMGIWERMSEKFHAALDHEFDFTSPREHGLDVVQTIKAMHEGRVKVFFAMGGNFLSATPDTEFTAQALRQCRLTAQVSTKLNRAHLITGRQALILPCLGRTEIDRQAGGEQFVTVEDSMGIVNPSRGNLEPASEHLLSEVAIVCGLARAVLGKKNPIDWEGLQHDYGRIRNHIERVIPGFVSFNQRIADGPFYLPNAARERRFETPSGKAVFTAHPLPDNDLPDGQFALMTMRSQDQFNTTIYDLDDRYRGIYNGRRVVFLNRQDVAELGLVQGQIVDLTSHFNGEKRTAEHFMVVPYDIPRRCAAAYFPEANVLVPVDSVTPKSGTPVSKFVPITLAPSANTEAAQARLRNEALAAARV
ncbi:MAG: FdhF/YdeP family oxidoreductase [Methylacidiphilales bacterium]|nr:FdhF/YdeP family oxidoreductase [Candidatus Methylacidiphilales bacterium]